MLSGCTVTDKSASQTSVFYGKTRVKGAFFSLELRIPIVPEAKLHPNRLESCPPHQSSITIRAGYRLNKSPVPARVIMKRVVAFVGCCVALLYFEYGKQYASAVGPTISAKPNIVVIVADDAGYNEFSFHGSQLYSTPRIDSIATNGVKFTSGYVSGTVCSPTRAGILTGRYQNRFGHEFNIPPVYSEDNGLSLEETTIADVLKSDGYRTIALGKWHLGYAPKFHPMERGFTDYYGFLQGARSFFPLEKPTRLNQLLLNRDPVMPESFEYMTDELGRAAADYITKSKNQPFFMYLAFNATHTPIHALESDIAEAEKTSSEKIKLRAMTIALDRAVGTVLDTLEQESLIENTLLIFVNDNGGAAGHDNSPLRGQKGQTWEGGMRVPFAMQWPAVLPRGVVYDAPVISLDIFPTAMAAAGVIQSPGKPLDGSNLIPYLTEQPDQVPHKSLFWKNGSKWAVRQGDYKLVGGNPGQTANTIALYNLKSDISETTDISTSNPELVKTLTKDYQAWVRTHQPTPWGNGSTNEDDEDTKAKGRPNQRKRKNTSKQK